MFYNSQKLAELEAKRLAPYAVFSQNSQGRVYPEKNDLLRLCFQKDRDRIIHSRSFRRLRGKTQVFIAHYGDHYRTRLTHTLEVAQISQSIARNLGLNEDLAVAIAMAHDLGHTPFAHAGEEELNKIMQEFGLHFEHNEQSKRVVEVIEDIYPNFKGLNLTFEVREGLMKHQTSWDKSKSKNHFKSLEAEVVNLADEIAYQNHDIDDGLRAKILKWDDLKKLNLWQENLAIVSKKYGKLPIRLNRYRGISSLINLMIVDVLHESNKKLEKFDIKTVTDLAKTKEGIICFSKKMKILNAELKDFLSKKLYFHPQVLASSKQGKKIIREVFTKYFENISLLPQNMQKLISSGEKKEIVIKDYIASMTDQWLIRKFH